MSVNILGEAEFRKSIAGGISGCYLLFGEEDYLKNYCLTAAAKAICPDEGLDAFNRIVIDFPDYSADVLEDALASPPMMCERKLVILKSFNYAALKPGDAEDFCAAVAKYRDDPTNLVLVSVIPGGIDEGYLPKKPSAVLGKLEKIMTLVRFEESTPAKLGAWASRHFAGSGVRVSDATVRFLLDYCGHSMYTLSSEIGKLCAYVLAAGRDEVTPDDIRKVSVPELETDTFALSNAVLSGNRAAALEALAAMKFRQVKPEMILAELSGLYCNLYMTSRLLGEGKDPGEIARILKMHEYKAGLYVQSVRRTSAEALSRGLGLCVDADLAMKSFARRDYEQIEKLICLQ